MAYQQFAYHYDRLMEEMPYVEWIRFAKAVWHKYGVKPETVVDLGCGTGNIAIPLAQEGCRVIGIDVSEDMLAVAQEKYERSKQQALFASGGQAIWLQQDLRDWELPEPADAVISFCDCLNYLLEEDDIVQAFRRAVKGLKPGGVFAFDVHTPQQLEAYAATQPFFLNEDDIAYIWTSELDDERMEIEHDLTIFVQESPGLYRKIEETHVQRAYPLAWLERQLAAAGFTDIACTADFTWEPPKASSQRAFFTARKRG
jgi:SAM-dependent methyltransferase